MLTVFCLGQTFVVVGFFGFFFLAFCLFVLGGGELLVLDLCVALADLKLTL